MTEVTITALVVYMVAERAEASRQRVFDRWSNEKHLDGAPEAAQKHIRSKMANFSGIKLPMSSKLWRPTEHALEPTAG